MLGDDCGVPLCNSVGVCSVGVFGDLLRLRTMIKASNPINNKQRIEPPTAPPMMAALSVIGKTDRVDTICESVVTMLMSFVVVVVVVVVEVVVE